MLRKQLFPRLALVSPSPSACSLFVFWGKWCLQCPQGSTLCFPLSILCVSEGIWLSTALALTYKLFSQERPLKPQCRSCVFTTHLEACCFPSEHRLRLDVSWNTFTIKVLWFLMSASHIRLSLPERWKQYNLFCKPRIPTGLKDDVLSPRNDGDSPRLGIQYALWMALLTQILSDNTHLVIFNKTSQFQFFRFGLLPLAGFFST